ncbi:MAG: drug resistance transporter, EmrB/QacA subfamily [Acidimicrobiaceae bacterium]|nr:drug resistance transporter, EmrB/QacA subfamily [Acidimicrobiaceae bacterium]
MALFSRRSTGETESRRWIALVVVCLAMLMASLDSSIVNVALPSIQRSLHFSQSSLTWVVDSYLIAFGSFLLLAGRLGDLLGRKKVFLSGVALFTASSLVCSLAQNQATLITARFFQGLGGAVSTSVIVAIIVTEFTGPQERAKAMSSYMFVAVGGGSIGLLVGGALTQAVSWHWIFLINVPIGIITLVLGSLLIRENEGLGVREGIDIAGSLLMTLSLIVGIYAIVTSSTYGWLSSHTLGFGAAALVLGGVFAVVESRVAKPIIPTRILRLRSLMASSVVRAFAFSAMFAVFFFGALYMEKVLGYGPLKTGVAFLPLTLVAAVTAISGTGRLLVRFGPMRLLIPGLCLVIVGLALLSRTGVHAQYATSILPALLLLGGGISISSVPLLTVAMADVPQSDSGLASGIVNVSMWLASSATLAVLGTLAASRTRSLSAHQGISDALVSGYHETFLIGALMALAGLVVAVVVLRAPAKEVVDARNAETSDGGDVGAYEIAQAEL